MKARPWFVIVRDSARSRKPRTLVGIRFPPDGTTIYRWAARAPHPIRFATVAEAQTYLDRLPPEERPGCRVEPLP
jgi:hypothetical protein